MSQPEWLSDVDLTNKQTTVQAYTDRTIREQIQKRAEYQDRSESQIAGELLLEGLLATAEDPGQVPTQQRDEEESGGLQERVEELEEKLEAEQQQTDAGLGVFDEEDLKERVLTEQYQSLEEIKHRVAETGLLDEALLTPLENQLWKLVAWDQAEFERGYGWKLADHDGGEAR